MYKQLHAAVYSCFTFSSTEFQNNFIYFIHATAVFQCTRFADSRSAMLPNTLGGVLFFFFSIVL